MTDGTGGTTADGVVEVTAILEVIAASEVAARLEVTGATKLGEIGVF